MRMEYLDRGKWKISAEEEIGDIHVPSNNEFALWHKIIKVLAFDITTNGATVETKLW